MFCEFTPGGITIKILEIWSSGHGFDPQFGWYQVVTTSMSLQTSLSVYSQHIGCAKKMAQLVFVRTSSNIHQIW